MKNSILLFNPRPDPYYKPIDLPISLICVSRFLEKEGYPINIIAENLYPDPYKEIRESAKDALVLGISAMTGLQIQGGLKASQIAKEANKNIKSYFPFFISQRSNKIFIIFTGSKFF